MIPLYIKTHYSFLTSMITIDDLIKFAKQNSIKSLTITDNNLYGALEFYKKCHQNKIKPIIGMEINLEQFKIILYCQNYTGYQNLLKINTIILTEELTIKHLSLYSEGLLCIIPFNSLSLYNELKKIYKYVFQSYQNIEQKQELTGDVIYMNEIICLEKEDEEYLKYLWAIRDGTLVSEVSRDYKNKYLKLSNDLENAELENNSLINELCNLELKFNQSLIPKFECPDEENSYHYLKKLCIAGLKEKFGKQVNRIYIERLEHELQIIDKMGFSDYFLIVWDYVKYAKEANILVGPGRGSAAGSLVSYLLNITTVDPLKYDLLFERFLNPERINMPDIDIDFEDNRREEVINYCLNKYGLKRVAPIITFGSLGAKQVIRDVARTMEIDLKVVDHISKLLHSNLSLIENYNRNEKLRKYLENKDKLLQLYKIASRLEGLKRHSSVHAAGIVMANTDLDNIIPLDKKHDNFFTTGYDMEYLEELGLLKMDFLGLRNLTLISDVLADLKRVLMVELSFSEIPLNDVHALGLFRKGTTEGIFQFESEGMRNFLRKLYPTSFEDICAANALFRPGPMENIDLYIKRKHDQEKIDSIHPEVDKILKSTYGIIVYQEQIMQIVRVMADYSFAEADILRRAMSKKQESVMKQEKERFINGCLNKGYPIDKANYVYDLISKFAAYGFNRSHAVAYSMIACRMAYLKAHYPLFFMKSLLSMVVGSEIKTKEYVYECKANNISIISPDINLSFDEYIVTKDGIFYPLSIIKGIGTAATKTIIQERENGKYKDMFDFIKRVYGKSVNKKTIISLIKAGCFKSIGLNKKTMLENLDIIVNYGELIKDIGEEFALKPEIKKVNEYSKKELMQFEFEIFGFYISDHPVTEHRIKNQGVVELKNIKSYFDKVIETIVYIDRIKKIKTKYGDEMCFLTGSDELKVVDMVMFPKTFLKYSNIEPGKVVKITGKVEKRFDKFQIIVNFLKILDEE